MTRDILCDSGFLISLTSACLDSLLYFFAEKSDVRFVIPPSVEQETVTHPIEANLHRYLFSAMRIKNAIEDGVVVVVDSNVRQKAESIITTANNLYYIRGKSLHLMHLGEAEMLVLAKELGIEYVLLDERTTRMLIESPILLKEHFEKEFSVNVMVNKKNYDKLKSEISSLKALRSSEFVMLAYENGFFKNFKAKQKSAVESALYKMKYSGCSISFDEITEYLNLVK